MIRRTDCRNNRTAKVTSLVLVCLLSVSAAQGPSSLKAELNSVVSSPELVLASAGTLQRSPVSVNEQRSVSLDEPGATAEEELPTAATQEHRVYLPLVGLPQHTFLPLVSSSAVDSPSDAGEAASVTARAQWADTASRGFVTRKGEDLQLDGRHYTFVGINMSYLVGPYFPMGEMEQAIAFLASHGVQAMRVWVEPGYSLDKVEYMLDLGSKYGVRFVMTLQDFFGNQDGWWFQGKYQSIDLPWIQTVVPRFAQRPEVLMWELMNEPTCPGADANEACWKAFYQWAQITSQEIKRLDPNHLVSVGMQRAGFEQGEVDTFRRIHALETIDIVSVHTEGGRVTKGARQLERDIAHDLGKPVFFGEVYAKGHTKGCQPISEQVLEQRALALVDDVQDSREAGVDGYLLWQYAHCFGALDGDPSHCFCGELDYYADDPVWGMLRGSE